MVRDSLSSSQFPPPPKAKPWLHHGRTSLGCRSTILSHVNVDITLGTWAYDLTGTNCAEFVKPSKLQANAPASCASIGRIAKAVRKRPRKEGGIVLGFFPHESQVAGAGGLQLREAPDALPQPGLLTLIARRERNSPCARENGNARWSRSVWRRSLRRPSVRECRNCQRTWKKKNRLHWSFVSG